MLHFISGHKQIIASPAAISNSPQDREAIEDIAFSVLDAETGKILRSIPGPHPGEASRFNIAKSLAVSPDERFVAALFADDADRHVAIYSVDDWKRIASIDLGSYPVGARDLAFSPDGKLLAVIHGRRGSVKLFETGSWTFQRTIEAFPEAPPPMRILMATVARISPDGTMIAVGSFGGGAWWKYPNGDNAPKGAGKLVEQFPADPLRVFRIADGRQIAALKSFPGGFLSDAVVSWSPHSHGIVFADAIGDIRIWYPLHDRESVILNHVARANALLVSNDGALLAVCAPEGVQLYQFTSR